MTTNKPTKVVIEITAKGWSERVYSGDTVIAEKSYTMESRGSARSSDSDGWHDLIPDDFEQLSEELEDLSFGPFGVAVALYEIEEVFDDQ